MIHKRSRKGFVQAEHWPPARAVLRCWLWNLCPVWPTFTLLTRRWNIRRCFGLVGP